MHILSATLRHELFSLKGRILWRFPHARALLWDGRLQPLTRFPGSTGI